MKNIEKTTAEPVPGEESIAGAVSTLSTQLQCIKDYASVSSYGLYLSTQALEAGDTASLTENLYTVADCLGRIKDLTGSLLNWL